MRMSPATGALKTKTYYVTIIARDPTFETAQELSRGIFFSFGICVCRSPGRSLCYLSKVWNRGPRIRFCIPSDSRRIG